MEIRFWDIEKKEYVEDNGYFIDKDGFVYKELGLLIEDLEIIEHVKPHIYIAGRRVA